MDPALAAPNSNIHFDNHPPTDLSGRGDSRTTLGGRTYISKLQAMASVVKRKRGGLLSTVMPSVSKPFGPSWVFTRLRACVGLWTLGLLSL